jgi:DNA-binding MarR family transcriptional regulator
MNHSFNVEIAAKYGLEEAIILENIYFWCKKNEANGKLIDGKAWTYNSVRAFNELFCYLSPAVITRAIKNLEENGLIEVGFFNLNTYNRTKWYCITDLTRKLFESGIAEKKSKESDIAKVEKVYLENYKKLYESGNLKMKDPVINWTQSRKLTKTVIQKYGLNKIIAAVRKSAKNSICIQKGYSLTTILSSGVLAQLLNKGDITNDELSDSTEINF